jgi:hypothetical protein
MHSFRDTAGRTWEIAGNFANYARVKDRTGVDLFDIGTAGQKCLEQLSDLYTLGSVLWAFCERQAQSQGVSEDSFGQSLCGDEIDAAHTALINEAIFFSRRDRRELLTMAMRKVTEREKEMEEARVMMLREAGAAVDRAIDSLIQSSLATNSQESSESTLANGPSESFGGHLEGSSEMTGTTPAA